MSRQNLPFLFIVILLLSCKEDHPKNPGNGKRSFYYWQTSLDNFNWNDSLYRSMLPDKIYLRFFDVEWSGEVKAPMPAGELQWGYFARDIKSEIVPVVFITNETFRNLPADEVPSLARNVYRRVSRNLTFYLVDAKMDELYGEWWQPDPYQMKSRNFDEQRKYDSAFSAQMSLIKEIQFDCDWTKSTKDRYFSFLTEIAKLFDDKLITSTVRLYQYKYPNEAGVPPVKRGMLMCYNAGDIKDKEGANSIFDKDEIMEYLDAKAYPVPLDYALPVFEWALLFHDGKLKTILSSDVLLSENLQMKDENHYEVINDHVLGYRHSGTYLRKGDEIKIERPALEDVKEVAEWLSVNRNNKDASLSLYHLSNVYLQTHHDEMEDIFRSF